MVGEVQSTSTEVEKRKGMKNWNRSLTRRGSNKQRMGQNLIIVSPADWVAANAETTKKMPPRVSSNLDLLPLPPFPVGCERMFMRSGNSVFPSKLTVNVVSPVSAEFLALDSKSFFVETAAVAPLLNKNKTSPEGDGATGRGEHRQ